MSQYNDSNKMQGFYNLAWFNEELKGKSTISKDCNDTQLHGQSNIQIDIRNKAQGSFGVKTYPKQSMTFDVTQDTFVSEKIPSLNYGNYSYIKIGTDSNGKRYRSFLQFDLSELPKNVFITRAKLILHSQVRDKFVSMEIDTIDRAWLENSITWNGHPSRKQLTSIQQVSEGVFKYEFDVRNVVKDIWLEGVEDNYGFLLKGYDESIKQIKTFLSKEYGQEFQPKLFVEFFDPNAFIPPNDYICGQATISAKKTDDSLKGVAIINKEIFKSFIRGQVRIDNGDRIFGKANIVGSRHIDGRAKIVYFDEQIHGQSIIETTPLPDDSLRGQSTISRELIFGKASILAINKMVGTATITHETIWGKAIICGKNDITGKAKIRTDMLGVDYIEGKASIIYTFEDNELKGKANISFRGKNQLNGTSNIIGSRHIEGKASIVYAFEDNKLKGQANINSMEKNQLNGTSNIIGSRHIEGKAKIVYFDEQIHGIAKVIYFDDKLKGQAKIIIKFQDGQLKGQVNIVAKNDELHGQADISRDFMYGKSIIVQHSDIQGKAKIYEQKDLKGKAEIRYGSSLDGKVTIQALEFYDIQGKANIDGIEIESLSYVFIM